MKWMVHLLGDMLGELVEINVSLVDRNVELGNTNGALGKINVALSDNGGA